MTLVNAWTGRTACALQAALRLSNESFAEHLGVSVRTVAAWHQKPTLKPKSEMQQLLDWPDVELPVVPVTWGTSSTASRPEPAPETTALIVYTSGTTGPPKGALIPRRAIAADLDALAEAWAWTREDVLVHGCHCSTSTD